MKRGNYSSKRVPVFLEPFLGAGEVDPLRVFAKAGIPVTTFNFAPKERIFSQGTAAHAVFYVQSGEVRLTAVSNEGKEATLALLGEGDFLGEQCMAEPEHVWMTTAVAVTDCVVCRVRRSDMAALLGRDPHFLNSFLAFLLARSLRMQGDLIDQLFNSSEKRLARALLLQANFSDNEIAEVAVPRVSHESLAAMVGTTRSRISFFMNRFRKHGFIHYSAKNAGMLTVRRSLVSVLTQSDICPDCGPGGLRPADCIRCTTASL